MSGPKSSNYRLTAQQMAILLEQQRREREKELERQRQAREKEHRDKISGDIKAILAGTLPVTEHVKQLLKESDRPHGEADAVLKRLTEAGEQLNKLQKEVPQTSENMKKLNVRLQTLQNAVSAAAADMNALAETIGSSYRAELSRDIQAGFTLSFAGIGTREKKENRHLERIKEILNGIGPDIPSALKARFELIRKQADEITSADYLENFCAVVVTPFAKDCAACAEYDALLANYRLLCRETRHEEKAFDCSARGIKEMKAAVKQLEETAAAEREREYICSALEAAMREMGYQLVGDRTVKKKTGAQVRHGLYSLENGTAVDVTYAENGQIAMELGGIGTSDRVPTADESEQLVQDMHTFCGHYSQLEEKLEQRGVLSKRLRVMPPAPEYAQIFNIGDYHMLHSVENYCVETRSARQTTEKHME